MTSRRLIPVAAAMIAAAAPAVSNAQQTDKLPDGSVDFAVPDAPAFTYLGATPTKISEPGSIKDFALEIVNGIRDGNVTQGLALSARPWFLIPGLNIPLTAYQQRGLLYILANTQLSIGTVQTSGDTGSTDYAVGVRAVLFDDGDSMASADYTGPLATKMRLCNLPETPGEARDQKEERLECYATKTKPLREAWAAGHWNASRLNVAGALAGRAPASVVADSTFLGAAAWVVAGTGFKSSWLHLLGQFRYDYRRPERTHDLQYGIKALVGRSTIHAFGEVTGTHRWNAPAGTDANVASWTGGVELRLADKLWLATGFGSGFLTDESDPVVVIANLKWGLSNDARFDPRPPTP